MPIPPEENPPSESDGSALRLEELCAAEGRKPTRSDIVTIHYRGELADGTVFDSSYERGEPLTVPLLTLISGLQEGLQRMSAGARYRFVIPPQLAYGSYGAGPIPPGATLTYEVTLLAVRPARRLEN